MSRLEISVVICAYTEARWDQLVSAIASVQNQVYPAHKIVVVIDHNPALFRRVHGQFRQVVATENKEKRGLSGARNSGIGIAQGDVVAFLDDDAVAAPDWLAGLAEKYADPRVVGVGGSIDPRWEESRPRWFPEEFDWVVGCTYQGMSRNEDNLRNLIGCNMSFRRDLFEKIGGFRAEFGRIGTGRSTGEETEFCIRVHQNDPEHRLSFAPSAKVFHHVPSKRARWGYFESRCLLEGMAKAQLSRLLGAGDGLSSERSYVVSALPRGILHGLSDVIRHRDISGVARAGAIVIGLSFTAVGYLKEMLSRPAVRLVQASKDVEIPEPRTIPRQASAPISVKNGD